MKTVLFPLLLSLLINADEPATGSAAAYRVFLKKPDIYKQQIASEGKAIFERNCSYCHGRDGSGQGGFAADLRKRISKESALHIIQNGANNFQKKFPYGMPSVIKDEKGAKIVAEFISLGMPPSHPGAEIYKQARCTLCHGDNGDGFGYYGSGKNKTAPNIKKFDLQTLMAILKNGKTGVIGNMHSFHYLSDEELKLVSMHVMSLSE